MKSSKSLKPPLLLTISCIPYCFFYRCIETTFYTYLMKTWRAIVVIPSQSFKHTITLRIPVKTDWLCYLGCRQAEETVVSRGFTLVVVTNYIRQLERKLVQIILEGLPPQSLTSKPLNKHLWRGHMLSSKFPWQLLKCGFGDLAHVPQIVSEPIRASSLAGCLMQ